MESFVCAVSLFSFFNDTATTEIYTLSLHDALPIYARCNICCAKLRMLSTALKEYLSAGIALGWKSTHPNSRHQIITYSAFFLTTKMLCGDAKRVKAVKKNWTKTKDDFCPRTYFIAG